MERIEARYQLFKKALTTLEIVLAKFKNIDEEHEYYQEIRDSVIQRFEYSIDTFWKLLKDYLEKYYHLDSVASPKGTLKACVTNGLVTSDEYDLFVKMLNDRNLTSHAYNSSLAEEISEAVPQYYILMKHIVERIMAEESYIKR
jgi:nucleotidyltransferase substrate binding protein (TIGR01987 family)